jgi:hypothetical protein
VGGGPEKLKSENEDQKVGINIIRKALSWPARLIATNAGEDGAVVAGKILENTTYSFGYNAQSGEYGDLTSQGVIVMLAIACGYAHIRPCSARRSRDEWIGIEVPATIPRDLFEREQPIELASETPGRRNSCPA